METADAVGAVLDFLGSRTPVAWVDDALADLDTLLQDHATLELKAAQQAQNLIRRYASAPPAGLSGTRPGSAAATPAPAFRSRLVQKLSRLAREELRHFEQVIALIERRGGVYRQLPPSRYAAGLHALARREEPGALVDALLIGAVIEARSCERFFCLVEPLAAVDPGLSAFYAALLRAEARHYQDHLALATLAANASEDIGARLEVFLARDAELVAAPDERLRFHSGPLAPPATAGLRARSQ